MPVRSNDFQSLVALIERSLAPIGAKITESAMVTGADGEMREIDVLVEGSVGPYSMKIAVEAKDEKRKMDLVKFESIIGKYSGLSQLKVNKVVVVAKAGFSKNVVSRAERENITLLTLENAMVEDWASSVQHKVRFRVCPHLAGIDIEPKPSQANIGKLMQQGRLICKCCGKDHGNPIALAVKALNSFELVEHVRRHSSLTNKPACTRPSWNFGENVELVDGDLRVPAHQLSAHIHCVESRGDLNVAAYKHGDDLIHHFEGCAGGARIQFVVPHGPHSPQIVTKIEPSKMQNELELGPTVVEMPPFLAPTLPADVAAQIDGIAESMRGLNVNVNRIPVVHDFGRGVDVKLLVTFDFLLGPNARFRSTVLSLLPDVDPNVWMPWARQLQMGAELDRVIIVGGKPGQFDNTMRVVQLTQANELSKYICPNIALVTQQMSEFEVNFFSDTSRIFGSLAEAQLEFLSKRRMRLVDAIGPVMAMFRHNARRVSIRDLQRFRSSAYQFVMQLETELPVGTLIIAEGKSQSVRRLQGSGTIKILTSACKNAQLVSENGKRCLRYFPSEAGYPSVTGCGLEERDTLKVGGAIGAGIWRTRNFVMNNKELDGVFGHCAPSGKVAAHRIANIKYADKG